jgi:transcriptional regulator of met regulon
MDNREGLYRFGTIVQFGTEMNQPYFSIKLNANSCDSCTISCRLDVIEVLTNRLQVINLNCNENSKVIGTAWYQSRH